MPSWDIFERQPKSYRDSVLPPEITARVAVEQGSVLGWERYVGAAGRVIGMNTFGASAPLKELQRKFGFEPERVVAVAKELLGREMTVIGCRHRDGRRDEERGARRDDDRGRDREDRATERALRAPPCAMVIFGAAGDLTKRLVVPALYNLSRSKRLSDGFRIVGVDLASQTHGGMARKA